jgi:hypothetical protein
MFSGEGINRKTEKRIKFQVPGTISKKGLENIMRNIQVTKIEPTDLEVQSEKIEHIPLFFGNRLSDRDRVSGDFIAIRDQTGKLKRFDPERIDFSTASPEEIRAAILWKYATCPTSLDWKNVEAAKD